MLRPLHTEENLLDTVDFSLHVWNSVPPHIRNVLLGEDKIMAWPIVWLVVFYVKPLNVFYIFFYDMLIESFISV